MSGNEVGRLYVSHWEPDIPSQGAEGYLSGSLKLDRPPVWVHIVATTAGAGPRIVHGSFDGGLARAMIDLPIDAKDVAATLHSDGEPAQDALKPPPRSGAVIRGPGAPAGPRHARRLTLTWTGPQAAADDAELLATSRTAQEAVRRLVTWTRTGRPSGRDVTIEDLEAARLRLIGMGIRPSRSAIATEAYCSESSVTRSVKDAGYRDVREFLRVSDAP